MQIGDLVRYTGREYPVFGCVGIVTGYDPIRSEYAVLWLKENDTEMIDGGWIELIE